MKTGREDLPLRAVVWIALLGCLTLLFSKPMQAQDKQFRNPILFADYSDPDVLRHGDDYYLVASSFHFSPGLPILHSLDLVHWELAGHALARLPFDPAYDMKPPMRYGGGVWAPSLRFHNGLFYIYFPTPQEGIFVVTAPSMNGPWSPPKAVIAGPGLEDPCPFWDDDGNAYLVHSRLRAGPLILHRMAPDGMSVLDEGKTIVDDHKDLPVLEGPKFYKRNGWYYIFAPMGGVGVGSQAVLRSHNIYGPYEHRIVLARGTTNINGPHQGGWVETPDGKGWFIHFQSRGAHGRIDHLEPVRWENDWPIIGEAAPGATTGQPVASGPLPVIAKGAAAMHPQTSDEFNERTLPAMWEWNHNPDPSRYSLTARPGFLRLTAGPAADLFHARNTLTECMQDDALTFTARLDSTHLGLTARAGVSLFDKHLSYIAVTRNERGLHLLFSTDGHESFGPTLTGAVIDLRVDVDGDEAHYSYSQDNGRTFILLGDTIHAQFSWWKGARPALFAFNPGDGDGGYADFDWAHYAALPNP